jgi:HAMP domain-containing protein
MTNAERILALIRIAQAKNQHPMSIIGSRLTWTQIEKIVISALSSPAFENTRRDYLFFILAMIYMENFIRAAQGEEVSKIPPATKTVVKKFQEMLGYIEGLEKEWGEVLRTKDVSEIVSGFFRRTKKSNSISETRRASTALVFLFAQSLLAAVARERFSDNRGDEKMKAAAGVVLKNSTKKIESAQDEISRLTQEVENLKKAEEELVKARERVEELEAELAFQRDRQIRSEKRIK